MTYKMTVSLLHRPEGDDVRISGLGTFKNGGTYEISDELHDQFRAFYATDEGEHDTDPESPTAGSWISKPTAGPVLHEVSAHGVTFERTQPEATSSKKAGTLAKVATPTKGPVESSSQGSASGKGGAS